MLHLNAPAPRFFYFMSYTFNIGLVIVPKHIYEGEDWTTLAAYNVDEGLPVTTGPWEVAFSSPEQKLLDRRDSWWAVDQGLFDELPRIERVVYLPSPDIGAIVAKMLRQNGIQAEYAQPPVWWPIPTCLR